MMTYMPARAGRKNLKVFFGTYCEAKPEVTKIKKFLFLFQVLLAQKTPSKRRLADSIVHKGVYIV